MGNGAHEARLEFRHTEPQAEAKEQPSLELRAASRLELARSIGKLITHITNKDAEHGTFLHDKGPLWFADDLYRASGHSATSSPPEVSNFIGAFLHHQRALVSLRERLAPDPQGGIKELKLADFPEHSTVRADSFGIYIYHPPHDSFDCPGLLYSRGMSSNIPLELDHRIARIEQRTGDTIEDKASDTFRSFQHERFHIISSLLGALESQGKLDQACREADRGYVALKSEYIADMRLAFVFDEFGRVPETAPLETHLLAAEKESLRAKKLEHYRCSSEIFLESLATLAQSEVAAFVSSGQLRFPVAFGYIVERAQQLRARLGGTGLATAQENRLRATAENMGAVVDGGNDLRFAAASQFPWIHHFDVGVQTILKQTASYQRAAERLSATNLTNEELITLLSLTPLSEHEILTSIADNFDMATGKPVASLLLPTEFARALGLSDEDLLDINRCEEALRSDGARVVRQVLQDIENGGELAAFPATALFDAYRLMLERFGPENLPFGLAAQCMTQANIKLPSPEKWHTINPLHQKILCAFEAELPYIPFAEFKTA